MDEKDVDQFLEKTATLRSPPSALSAQRYADLKGRQSKEQELWHKWDANGRRPEDLSPLLSSLDPLIRSETTKRLAGLGGSIPRAALHNQLRNVAVRGIQSYDPERGALLKSHVHQNFMRVTDFVAANRNERSMPRKDVERYQEYRNAVEEAVAEHGREPSLQELQQRLPGWSTDYLRRMARGFGAEVYTDMGTAIEGANDFSALRPADAVQLAHSKMRPEERVFAQHYYPREGQQPRIPEVAKAMGITAAKAYRLKSRVESHIGPILKGE